MVALSFRPSDRLRMLYPRKYDSGLVGLLPVVCSNDTLSRHITLPVCDFTGFFPTERHEDTHFAWTKDWAHIDCHFVDAVPLRHVWLSVFQTAPGGSKVVVQVDGGLQKVFPRVKSNRILRIPLAQKIRVRHLRIRLMCETFIPEQLIGNGDFRELGIALRRVVLGRNWIASLRGLQCPPEALQD